MKELAHQWVVSPEQRGGGWAIECESHGVVALAIQRDKHPLNGKEVTWAEARANALKISAVDELLDALQYALPYLEACVPNPRNGINSDFSIDVNCVDRAKAAIAKANGETP